MRTWPTRGRSLVPACSSHSAETSAGPQHPSHEIYYPSQPCAGSVQAARKLRLNLGGDNTWPGSCHLSAEMAELLGDQHTREPRTLSLFILLGFWRMSAPSPMSPQSDAGLQHLLAPTKIPDGVDHAMAMGLSTEPQAQRELDNGSRQRKGGEGRREQSTAHHRGLIAPLPPQRLASSRAHSHTHMQDWCAGGREQDQTKQGSAC